MATKISMTKIEEGEFIPSKAVPDILQDGRVMEVWWTLQGNEIFSFVVYSDGLPTDEEGNDIPRLYKLYGAIHGKQFPWQFHYADLEAEHPELLLCAYKAPNSAKAQLRLMEKAQEVCDKILAAASQTASPLAKIAAWKLQAHMGRLYDKAKLVGAWFLSNHADQLERVLDEMDTLSDKDRAQMQGQFEKLSFSERNLWKSRRGCSVPQVELLSLKGEEKSKKVSNSEPAEVLWKPRKDCVAPQIALL